MERWYTLELRCRQWIIGLHFPRTSKLDYAELICQRRNKGWLGIRNEQQYRGLKILNFSNSLNRICFPVFHVPTNERVIKANSFGMKITLWRMYGLTVICVRSMSEWIPVEIRHKTDGLIKNQWRLRKRWKWLTLRDKAAYCRIWEKFLLTLRRTEVYWENKMNVCAFPHETKLLATWEKVTRHTYSFLLLRDTESYLRLI